MHPLEVNHNIPEGNTRNRFSDLVTTISHLEVPKTMSYISGGVESSVPSNPLIGDGWDDIASALISSGGLKAMGDYITVAFGLTLAPQTYNGAVEANNKVKDKLSEYTDSLEKKKLILGEYLKLASFFFLIYCALQQMFFFCCR